MKKLKVASVQFNHHAGDKAYNLSTIKKFVYEAQTQGVELITFPEMCISGYWHLNTQERHEIEAQAEAVPNGPSSQALLALSQETGITIGAGLIEIDADGNLYNTFVLAMSDGQITKHRKLHTFVSQYMSSGNEYTVVDTPHGWRVGILICWDNNLVENVRITALKGADLLLAPHQTGGCHSRSPNAMGLIDPQLWHNRDSNPQAIKSEMQGRKGREWLMRWLPARAHDNGLFLIFSNGVGVDVDEVRTGNAMILNPYGEIITETDSVEDDMVIAELDPTELEMCTGRRWIRGRRPDLYTDLTQPLGHELDPYHARFDDK
ncbi:nitrilase family protein [Vibrio coralliilyticus]|uniref:nitrilase family protein n=1 Tax=Vibrio coralliilyticus TaxID=190893 RepID=UPI00148B6EDE|nr:nitrilase family protein [Vibrio coralliilyticus]NOI27559.1 acyltransferase [Vibrio coralliilyticus]NOI47321.1 acyltransferase [Vibrio coralliilyticus]